MAKAKAKTLTLAQQLSKLAGRSKPGWTLPAEIVEELREVYELNRSGQAWISTSAVTKAIAERLPHAPSENTLRVKIADLFRQWEQEYAE